MIKDLYLSGIRYESFADGIGVRAVIFISGCKHNCPGCQSPMTHSFTAGHEVTDDVISSMIGEISNRKFLSGITLSGGDPFYSPKKVIELLSLIPIPHDNVWAYSGFTYEEILKDSDRKQLLEHVDVLVDGPFIQDKRDITLRFRGSSNQRIIDVKKSLADGTIHELS